MQFGVGGGRRRQRLPFWNKPQPEEEQWHNLLKREDTRLPGSSDSFSMNLSFTHAGADHSLCTCWGGRSGQRKWKSDLGSSMTSPSEHTMLGRKDRKLPWGHETQEPVLDGSLTHPGIWLFLFTTKDTGYRFKATEIQESISCLVFYLDFFFFSFKIQKRSFGI